MKEERSLVPSPKVPTYDLQPEMNAAGVAKAVSIYLSRREMVSSRGVLVSKGA